MTRLITVAAPLALITLTACGHPPTQRYGFIARLGRDTVSVESITRDLLAAGLRQVSPRLPDDAIDEYWKAFGDAERRRSQLELYRSGDFSKLKPYSGKLAALGVPALIIWGAKDQFAPVGGAYRFQKELPAARLVVLDEAGHFLMEDDPDRVAAEIRAFLSEQGAAI